MAGAVNTRAMWIIGGPLLSFFLCGGLAFWHWQPELGIGQIWVAVSLLLLVIYGAISYRVARGQAQRKELLANGLRGRAQILSVEPTGVSINRQPVMALRLKIELPGKPPYERVHKEILPLVTRGALDAGVVPVAVDRNNPRKLALLWEQAAPAPARSALQRAAVPSSVERMRQLDALREQGLISEAEFAQKKKQILDEI